MAFWNRFFGSAGSQAVGVAIGTTAVPALLPAAQEVINEAWQLHPNRPPDVYLLALGVAQGQVDENAARTWAHMQGFGDGQFDAMLAQSDTGPGVASAFELWRRGFLDQAGFERAAKREGLEDEWISALVHLKRELLSVSELANAVVQGHRDLDAAAEDAALQGINTDDFATLVANTGLPPGPETGLDWLRRGVLDQGEFGDLIREGHTKTKYIEKYLAALHPVLSALQYVEARVRGWISTPEMLTGGALTGYSSEQMDLLFKIHGRPLSWHQVWIGLQRGGVYDGPTTGIAAPFLKALQESNIRPEWYNLAWAQRYSYPSAFVMRALVQSGVISQAEGEADLIDTGWRPDRAKQVTEAWATGTSAAGKEQTKAELIDEFEGGFITENELRDHLTALGYTGPTLDLEVHLADARRIKAWRDKGITALGKRYVASTMDAAAADGYLQELGVVTPETRQRIIGVWNIEREFK